MSKLQAPDSRSHGQVDRGFESPKLCTVNCRCWPLATGGKKVDQSANVIGGWVEGRGKGVRIFFILCDRCNPRVAIAFSCYRDLTNKF
jgi:hypothetical protein